ncbi:MAG TPA: DoxX family protein [Thermoanaerobaculia bacterium]|nr:DoxX family protein [Thermoanaerobaculia bacterium]
MKKWTIDTSALLLRLAAGLIFFPHGYGKVFGAGGAATFAQDMPSYGVPAFFGYVAAYSELICAVLLIAGLLTRLDALLLGCTMFVATFVVQLPDALRDPQGGGNKLFAALHGIELPLALLAICLALMLLGAGRFSLDWLLRVDERVGGIVRKKGQARVPVLH